MDYYEDYGNSDDGGSEGMCYEEDEEKGDLVYGVGKEKCGWYPHDSNKYSELSMLQTLKKGQPDAIWSSIYGCLFLDFDAPLDYTEVKKATLVLEALSFLIKNHPEEAKSHTISEAMALLEWSILPEVKGTKKALQGLRRVARDTYNSAIDNQICPDLFKLKSNLKTQVQSVEQSLSYY